jgi:uncharacterized membrane protein YeaQ/YmgE (transglycosylase-associated protein family)
MIVWILLGCLLGLFASKAVSTTGEGTIVDMLPGTVGALICGWIFSILGGGGATGLNMDTVYSTGIAWVGAATILTIYHVFFRRRML